VQRVIQVAQHNRDDDCWTVFRGKVYNTTAFFDYHPGGRNYMKMAAGRDGTALYDKHHAWVNLDFIMEKCLIGPLAGAESETVPEGDEDDADFDEEAARNACANARASDLDDMD
jgi:cytochrome b involved in lipid metabolism